jgi:transposase
MLTGVDMKEFYVGLDLGRKWTYATMIDGEKRIIKQMKLPCDERAMDGFFGAIPKESLSAAVEACGIWYGLYDYLLGRCNVVKVVNPQQTKMDIGGKKTDKLDSKRLAELLKADMVHESYVPPKAGRNYREKVRHRQSMVSRGTEFKNVIHAILRRENIKPPVGITDIFTKKGIIWLKQLGRTEILSYLELIDAIELQVNRSEAAIPNNIYKKEIELLHTMPGVGEVTAPVIMSEIVDIKRFGSPKALCKYAGLVPKVHQSGDCDRHGGLVKQSSKILRTALIQSAHGAIKKKDSRFKILFVRLLKRKKYNTAITIIAHKMLYIMWFMLTNCEEFHDGGIRVGE